MASTEMLKMVRKIYVVIDNYYDPDAPDYLDVLVGIFPSVDDMLNNVRSRFKKKKNIDYDPDYNESGGCLYYFYKRQPGITYYLYEVKVFELEFSDQGEK